ncbi:hypothetical protein B0H14DRAFT_2575402 [Mycena olivaceomarginata]|nr:hypothetical protein B0H14DRAFT_2575402 [Mycena olivaceomarginata]
MTSSPLGDAELSHLVSLLREPSIQGLPCWWGSRDILNNSLDPMALFFGFVVGKYIGAYRRYWDLGVHSEDAIEVTGPTSANIYEFPVRYHVLWSTVWRLIPVNGKQTAINSANALKKRMRMSTKFNAESVQEYHIFYKDDPARLESKSSIQSCIARSIDAPNGLAQDGAADIFKTSQCLEKWRDSLGIVVTAAREESEPPEDDIESGKALQDSPDVPETPPRAPSPMFFSHDIPDEEEDNNSFVPPPRAPSPEPEPEPTPQSKRATVEEVLDEDDPQNLKRFPDPFPGQEPFLGSTAFEGESAKTFGEGKTLFEDLRSKQTAAGVVRMYRSWIPMNGSWPAGCRITSAKLRQTHI